MDSRAAPTFPQGSCFKAFRLAFRIEFKVFHVGLIGLMAGLETHKNPVIRELRTVCLAEERW